MPEKELRREQVLSLTYSVNVRGETNNSSQNDYSVLELSVGAFFGFVTVCLARDAVLSLALVTVCLARDAVLSLPVV